MLKTRHLFRFFQAPLNVAATVWIVALLVIGIRILINPRMHSVYPIYSNAGASWRDGASLYRPSEKSPDVYRYSPIIAVLMAPFSLLPARTGEMLWRILNVGAYLAALSWWSRTVLPFRPNRTQHALLLVLVLPLSMGSINNGQCNPLVIGLLLAATAGAATERWNLTGICLAGACLFKVYPIAVALLLVVVYPRQLIGRLVLFLAAGLALPYLAGRPEYVTAQYLDWFHHMRSEDRSAWPLDLRLRDLQLFIDVWFTRISLQAYWDIQMLSAAAIALFCLIGRRVQLPPRPLLTLLFAFGCCWMTLVGPVVESCTFIFLIPALAAALVEAWQEERPVPVRALLAASFLIFLLAQIACWFPWHKAFQRLGPQPFANLLFCGYLVYLARDTLVKHRAEQRQPSRALSARAA